MDALLTDMTHVTESVNVHGHTTVWVVTFREDGDAYSYALPPGRELLQPHRT